MDSVMSPRFRTNYFNGLANRAISQGETHRLYFGESVPIESWRTWMLALGARRANETEEDYVARARAIQSGSSS